MKRISRRNFIKTGLAGLSAVSLSNFALPSAFAATGRTKALVQVQLAGGLDTLLAFPYMDNSPLAAVRNSDTLIPGAGLREIAAGLGVHPGLRNLFTSYGPTTKVMMQTANAISLPPQASHELATHFMLTGGVGGVTSRYAWTGRLYDNGVRLHGFGGDAMSFNCQTCSQPPLTTPNYEAFDISNSSYNDAPGQPYDQGGRKNAQHVDKVLRSLNAVVPGPDREVGKVEDRFRRSQKSMFSAIDELAVTMNVNYRSPSYALYSVVPAALTNDYHKNMYLDLAQKFRNIAQKLNQLKIQNQSEQMVFVLGLGGFDLHDTWKANGDVLMTILGAVLKLFRDDMVALGIDNDVMTICTSEFGRAVTAKGTGTDHGMGYPSFVTGGNVQGGVFGRIIPAAELVQLIPQNRNSWPREISQERILVEILEKHLGVQGNIAFPSPAYEQIPVYPNFRLLRT